jgi:hypothetical protein
MRASTFLAGLFVVLCAVGSAFAILVIVRLAILRLESPIGRFRDGLRAGRLAPAMRATDSRGRPTSIPSGRWMALVFSDHSLKEFPGLMAGIKSIQDLGVEVVVVTKLLPDSIGRLIALIPATTQIVSVSDEFYWSYNVRAMPFVTFVDPRGYIRSSGIVNYEDTLHRMWRESLSADELEFVP